MSGPSIPGLDGPFPIGSRSMGVKLLVVCALAVSMTIPAYFVGGLVQDRTKRAAYRFLLRAKSTKLLSGRTLNC